MAKKHKHEEHANHEAWAIPYGDLVTLLLALFVVMYSMSAINEGKFRVASDSLNAAFGGKPRSPLPIQVGPGAAGGAPGAPRPKVLPGAPPNPGIRGSAISMNKPNLPGPVAARIAGAGGRERVLNARERAQLEKMSDEVHDALGDLIQQKLVVVRRFEHWLEIEIQTDILFASGAAQLGAKAGTVLDRLSSALQGFDNRLRIEGHTDDMPISTREFPSNWELSSARAASVVHRFMARGVDPRRMTVLGLAEYQPVAQNSGAEGRNRNRRVVIVVLGDPGATTVPALPMAAAEPVAEPVATPAQEVAVAVPVPISTAVAAREHAEP